MKAKDLSSSALFTEYVNVANQAIGRRRDDFPFKQLLDAADSLLDDRKVNVGIYKTDADNPHDWFTMEFNGDTFDIAQHGKTDEGLTWKVSQEYLEGVVDNPSDYIENPTQLDFEWLKERVGIN